MSVFSRIIVTGGTGWLGHAVLTELTRLTSVPDSDFYKLQILVLVQSGETLDESLRSRVTTVSGDLRVKFDRAKLLKDSDGALVVNLAGLIHPQIFKQRDFFAVNHRAVADFARECVGAKVRKFIAMSSNSPCGYTKDNRVLFSEDSPYRPYMGYGKSKMQMEKAVLDLSHQDIKTNFTIVRSPWFYGPHQPARQSDFFRMIRKGVFPLVGGGLGLRSMTYVDNLCQGIILAAGYEESNGEIFWIADQRPYSMKEVVETVRALVKYDFGLEVSGRQVNLPSVVSDVARYVDSASQLTGLYVQKIHVLSEMNQTIACNVDKANKLLGYSPEISLEEGMRRSIQWCLENNRQI